MYFSSVISCSNLFICVLPLPVHCLNLLSNFLCKTTLFFIMDKLSLLLDYICNISSSKPTERTQHCQNLPDIGTIVKTTVSLPFLVYPEVIFLRLSLTCYHFEFFSSAWKIISRLCIFKSWQDVLTTSMKEWPSHSLRLVVAS